MEKVMRKFINVYSLPRSGTNLFAAQMMRYPSIVSYNVGGGRHPFRARSSSSDYEIFTGPGVFKDPSEIRYFLRDELKFGFVGPKVFWVEQLLFKLYERVSSSRQIRVILLRNPFSIASSMHAYQKKNNSHQHLWDMSNPSSRRKFIDSFFHLVREIPGTIEQGGYVVDPFSFFRQEKQRIKLLADLGLDNEKTEKITTCRTGHSFNLVDNKAVCECGELLGFGGYNPLKDISPDRLLTSQEFLDTSVCHSLATELQEKIGSDLLSYFSMNGKTDLDGLINAMLAREHD